MKKNSVLIGTAAAILLAPAVLNNISQTNVNAATNLVGIVKRGGGALYTDGATYANRTLPNFTSWKLGKSKVVNGVTYYRVATNEWISSQGIEIKGGSTTTPTTNIVKTPGYIGAIRKSGATAYDNNGNLTTNSFSSNTAWKLDAKKVVNGITYYRVATNQWLKADSMDVKDATGKLTNPINTATSNVTKTPGYIGTINSNNGAYGTSAADDNGNSNGIFYSTGTSWKLTGMKLFNGQAYYRIATNQWLLGSAMTIRDGNGGIVGNQSTPVPNSTGLVELYAEIYNGNGSPTGYVLPQGTEWKLGSVKTINGKQFYKVATDEYILTSSVKIIATGSSTPETVLYSGQSLDNNSILYNTETNTLSTDTNPKGTDYNILAVVENKQGEYWFKIAPNTWIKGLGFMDDSVYSYTTQEPEFALNATNHVYEDPSAAKIGTVTNGSTHFFDESTGQYQTTPVAEGTSWQVYTIVRNSNGDYFFKVGKTEWLNLRHLSLNFNIHTARVLERPNFGITGLAK